MRSLSGLEAGTRLHSRRANSNLTNEKTLPRQSTLSEFLRPLCSVYPEFRCAKMIKCPFLSNHSTTASGGCSNPGLFRDGFRAEQRPVIVAGFAGNGTSRLLVVVGSRVHGKRVLRSVIRLGFTASYSRQTAGFCAFLQRPVKKLAEWSRTEKRAKTPANFFATPEYPSLRPGQQSHKPTNIRHRYHRILIDIPQQDVAIRELRLV